MPLGSHLPLFADGLKKVRRNLIDAKSGTKPGLVRIGVFTLEQLTIINEARRERNFQPIDQVIVFLGKHLYESRCLPDGYTMEDVLDKVASALSEFSIAGHTRSATLSNPNERLDILRRNYYSTLCLRCILIRNDASEFARQQPL
jgi:hypothetical protein